MIKIGGHDNEFGRMEVWRTDRQILKVAYDTHNAEGLANEARILSGLVTSRFAPRLIAAGAQDAMTPPELEGAVYVVAEEDLGVSEPIGDGEALRHSAIQMLLDLRGRGVRHGDLTASNLVIRGNEIRACDWAESHLMGEDAPQKQPWSDAFLLMRTLVGMPGPDGHTDTPRIARRWMAVLEDLGIASHTGLTRSTRNFIDYGCYEGDFVALAAASGFHALGVDQGGFRSGENSIRTAEGLWAGSDMVRFVKGNLLDEIPERASIAMCFSVWPYVAEQVGRTAAEVWLSDVIALSDVLYFETQYEGDGPGPDYLQDDDHVRMWLEDLGGQPRAIATIPVTGRDAQRTVWAVR